VVFIKQYPLLMLILYKIQKDLLLNCRFLRSIFKCFYNNVPQHLPEKTTSGNTGFSYMTTLDLMHFYMDLAA